MTTDLKDRVSEYKRKYKVSKITEKVLLDIIEKQGYTVIFFNKYCNDENVKEVLDNLELNDMIQLHKGFTFANGKFRLVFINDELSEEERIMVLAHEEGHIYCDHMASNAVLGQDVRQEYEANEFAHFLLYPQKSENAKIWFFEHKKAFITVLVCIALVLSSIFAVTYIKKEKSYFGEFYVTSSGAKYHEKNCIIIKNKKNIRRLTKEEFESGKYEPCQVCLPN